MSNKDLSNLHQGINSQSTDETAAGLVQLDDEMLQSVAGGCTPGCGGFGSTPDFSCVPPGQQCP